MWACNIKQLKKGYNQLNLHTSYKDRLQNQSGIFLGIGKLTNKKAHMEIKINKNKIENNFEKCLVSLFIFFL